MLNTDEQHKHSDYEFRRWVKQSEIQEFVRKAIPMKSIVISCFDPRATEIPAKVAEYLGDEVYPGENILDESGNRAGHTRTLFAVANAGGRAADALQSILTMEYLFEVKNVIVVHHSFCGASGITPEVLIDEYKHKHNSDVSKLFDHESLSIPHFEDSIKYDIKLLRESPAVPKSVNLFGFFYEINSQKLFEICRHPGSLTHEQL